MDPLLAKDVGRIALKIQEPSVRQKKLMAVFKRMFDADVDASGDLPNSEVREIFMKVAAAMGAAIDNVPEEEIEAGVNAMIAMIDADHSGSISFEELMAVLRANEDACAAIETADEERFAEGLKMFTQIAEQFLAGDFSLKNAPEAFFALTSVSTTIHKLSKDFDIIGRLKRTEETEATDVVGLLRVKSILEKTVVAFDDDAQKMLQQAEAQRALEKEAGFSFGGLSDHRFAALKDCIFGGHLATDLDSIAGAIGAAHLYNGVPVRCSDVNSETAWALERWGFKLPAKIEDVITPEARVCLVDFQQMTQLNPAINPKQIVGVIDHHALQNATIVTDLPIYIDIRPWGSMATIIAHNFLTMHKVLPPNLAGLLLAAILSDTLNLQSPTSTDMDALIVGVLAKISNVGDANQYAKDQFKAKSAEIDSMSEHQLINGDLKKFAVNGIKMGFGVVETTNPEALEGRIPELLKELPFVKQEQGFDILFFAIVDIVGMRSDMLLCGPREVALAEVTFQRPHKKSIMDMGGKVSRKLDFVPALTNVLSQELHSVNVMSIAEVDVNAEGTEIVMCEKSNGRLIRVTCASE